MDELSAAALPPLTAAEVVRRLDAADIAGARMNGVAAFLDHPQLAARGRWRSVDSPVGPLRALLPPFACEGRRDAGAAHPSRGAHTVPIPKELGYDESTIEAWRASQVI